MHYLFHHFAYFVKKNQNALTLYVNMATLFGLSVEVYIICVVLGIPIYYFFRWAFRKAYLSADKKRLVTWAATILVTPLAYGKLTTLFFLLLMYEPQKEFRTEGWTKDKTKQYLMADDLINSKLLLNADTSKTKQILGVPNDNKSVNEWTYYIGSGTGLGFTDHFLTLKFKNSKVISVKHTSRAG